MRKALFHAVLFALAACSCASRISAQEIDELLSSDLMLTVSCPTPIIAAGQNTEIKVSIQNISHRTLSIAALQPFIFLTLSVQADGVVIAPQVTPALTGPDPDLSLSPGHTASRTVDLCTWFPLGLPAQTYEIGANYLPDRNDRRIVVKSGSLRLRARPRTAQEELQYQDYVGTLRASGGDHIEKCRQYLDHYPESMFEPRIRLEYAAHLDLKTNTDEIERVLGAAFHECAPTSPELEYARSLRARSLELNGRPKEAISVLEGLDAPWAIEKKRLLEERLNTVESQLPNGDPVSMTDPSGDFVDSIVGVSLQIGVTRYRESRQFYHGEPIWVGVNITRKQANPEADAKPVRIGTDELAWYDNISFRVAMIQQLPKGSSASESARPTRVVLPDLTVEKSVFQARSKEEEGLSPGQIVRSSWVIASAATAKWPAGEYVIEAIFDSTDKRESQPVIFHGRLQSNEVTVVITQPEDDKAKSDVLVAQARYNVNQEKSFDEAIRLLDEALRLNAANGAIHCQLGTAYERKGDFPSAIKEYRAYVHWVRSLKIPRTGKDDIYDHADIIEGLIKALEKRAAEKKE